MKSPSSTSSSETPASPDAVRSSKASRWPKATLLALVLLLAVEFGLARQEWVWTWVPDSNSGIIDAMEQQVLVDAPPPQIVLMGSSRVRDGVAPRRLEAALGLPKGAALNLGLTRGTPYDAALMYQRNREKLKQAKLLVLGVEDWSFNASLSPNERYRRFASLEERVGVYNADWTRSLVAGWFWRSYDAQGPLRRLLKSAVKSRRTKLPIDDQGRVQWRKKESPTGPATYDVTTDLKRFMRKYETSKGLQEQTHDLIKMARADGLQVVMIQVPLRDVYIEGAQEHYPEGVALYKENLEAFSDVPQHIWGKSSDLGIQQDWFYDYGHLTKPGADVFTQVLADALRPQM